VLLGCFGWAQLMLDQRPDRVLESSVRDRLLEAALGVLQRPEPEVAVKALRLIACLVARSGGGGDRGAAGDSSWKSPTVEEVPESLVPVAKDSVDDNDLFACTCHRLFKLMAADSTLLSSRGELIVRRLCDGVDVERFFATAARAVLDEEDAGFAQRLVRVLNWVLLTSRETQGLRERLRDIATAAPRPGTGGAQPGEEVPVQLMQLLLAWFRCPVSTLALCLWLHWFELAAEITARLASIQLSGEVSAQLTSFVELLESPIFVRVRLQLLESQWRPSLLRTVLGLVVLLPQAHVLRARLEIVKTGLLLDRISSAPAPPISVSSGCTRLLAKFDSVVALHGWQDCIL